MARQKFCAIFVCVWGGESCCVGETKFVWELSPRKRCHLLLITNYETNISVTNYRRTCTIYVCLTFEHICVPSSGILWQVCWSYSQCLPFTSFLQPRCMITLYKQWMKGCETKAQLPHMLNPTHTSRVGHYSGKHTVGDNAPSYACAMHPLSCKSKKYLSKMFQYVFYST